MTEFSGPIGKLRLGYKVAQTLGPRWVLTRLRLEAERRSGALERRTPASTWADYRLDGDPWFNLSGLHPEAAGECLRAQPTAVHDDLYRHLDALKQRHFDIFGSTRLVDDWHRDAIDDVTYPADVHWSRVPEFPEADLKLVWEPSRFGWAFDLARLHALDPTAGSPDVFWHLFEDWCESNQPFQGVNWSCGQEAAVRFMAVVFAVKAFRGEGLNEHRAELLAKFADVTAKRVMSHWRYARSQDNNHIVSEAVGLIGVGLTFPMLRSAQTAFKLGEKLLCEACDRLVFEDGGTSQYSSNYHRVFVDNFIWAVWLYRTAAIEPPLALSAALERAADLMCAITNPVQGDMASYGHNDGAHLLPLGFDAHSDVRSTLTTAASVVNSQWLSGPPAMEEGALWLFASRPANPPQPLTNRGPKVQIFKDGGISIITCGRDRAVIRGGRQHFRAAQCDFGHIELWIDGKKRVTDLGTASYKSTDLPDLGATKYHNAPHIPHTEQMLQLSRFLRYGPPAVSVHRTTADALWSATFTLANGTAFTRSITHDDNGWHIADSVDHESRVTWAMVPAEDDASTSRSLVPSAYAPDREVQMMTVSISGDVVHHFDGLRYGLGKSQPQLTSTLLASKSD